MSSSESGVKDLNLLWMNQAKSLSWPASMGMSALYKREDSGLASASKPHDRKVAK